MNIIEDIDLLRFMARQESQSIRPAADFIDEAMARLEQGPAVFGDPLPWSKTADKFRFRPSELTIWAGPNGQGKSLVMGQAALWFAADGKKVLIASMEMPGAATVARMMRQASGSELPSRYFADGLRKYTSDKVWIYDQIGSVKAESIIAMIHYAAEELGIDHVMIDSLVKCGVDSEHNEPQKKFVDALAWAAKEHKIHIHLVHHVRKQSDERTHISKYDIKGAGEISDLADNILLIYRNGAKEAKVRSGQEVDQDEADCYIRVAKQRHGEFEGLFGFWFHAQSQQWVPDNRKLPMPFPPPDAKGMKTIWDEVAI
jgi:twinkle protein